MYPNIPLQVSFVNLEDTGETDRFLLTTWLLNLAARRIALEYWWSEIDRCPCRI